MILRSERAETKGWWVIGEIKRISYNPTEYIWEGKQLVHDKKVVEASHINLVNCVVKNKVIVHINVHHLDESVYSILTNMPTYLCTEGGHTTERVV
jgi:hypothetical protein